MLSAFLANIRGWQFVIIIAFVLVFLIIPFLLGIRIGRGKRK